MSASLKSTIRVTWLSSSDGSSVPTVAVLFGWMGSTHQHLAKYAGIFQERSISTIQHTCPITIGVTRRQTQKRAALILDLLKDKLDEGSDKGRTTFNVVFHVMSNGGFLPYVQAVKLLDSEPKYRRLASLVRGTIIDSAPAYLSVASGAQAFSSPWIKSNFILRSLMLFLFGMILSIGSILYSLFTGKPFNHYAQFHYLESSPLHKRIPSLFLYSKDDHITDHKYLESFILDLKRSGAEVHACSFKPKSAHVAHLYHHREEYTNQVDNFLRRIL